MRRYFSRQHALGLLLSGLVVLLIGAVLVMDRVPPISRDALTHHLAVPKLYVKHGGMVEIPALAFSYYPMNLDLLYTVPLIFGNDILPKYIHFAFALLTAALIFSYLKRRLDSVFALAGVIFFLSLPVVVRLSTTIYVDLGLIFFSTLALIYFLKWIEQKFDTKYLIISAVGCGLALGTKYNALIVLFLLALFVPFVYSKKQHVQADSEKSEREFFNLEISLKAVGLSALYILVALMIFSPWAIRNYIWKKNPVYPLLHQVFKYPGQDRASDAGPEQPDIISEAARGPMGLWSPFATRKIVYGETWWQTLLIPVRIFFQGQDDRPKQFDGRLNPYLILLPVFAFCLGRGRHSFGKTGRNFFLTFAVLFIILSFFKADMRIRYIGPAIPPLVILSIYGLHNLISAIDDRLKGAPGVLCKGVVVLAVSLLVCLNAAYIWQLYHRIDPFSYDGSKLSRDRYIERYRPEYAALRFANETLPRDARILGLFLGNRSYYSDRELVFGDSFFRDTVRGESNAREILKALKEKRITHILVYFRVLKRWSGQVFDHQERVKLADFFNRYANLIFVKGEYGLYQL